MFCLFQKFFELTIDESAPKMPIQEQMKQAEERSRARAAAMDIQRRADIEEERRRRERQEEAYYPERKS